MRAAWLSLSLAAATIAVPAAPVAAQGAPQAVYLALADSVPGTLDSIAGALDAAFAGAGWRVLATYPAGGVPSCEYGARTLVLFSPAYFRVLGSLAPREAPFASTVRLAVFQDEAGTHVAMVNPLSVNRTMVAEQGLERESSGVIDEAERIVASAVHGVSVRRAYGQVRRRGYIGRTLGIMAGGPFPEKIETLIRVNGGTPEDLGGVADRVWAALRAGGQGRWQLHGIYRLDLPDEHAVVLGVSGAAMETRAFQIVGAGGDDARSRFRCPGLAYAPAFPIEVVVAQDSSGVRVTAVDAMYRMKMYFEDAGKMKFAVNMRMPGSIGDEIRALVGAAGLAGSR